MEVSVEDLVQTAYGTQAHDALKILRRYGAESWHPEVDRTHRAILSLSGGDLDRLNGNVEAALLDYRDVLYNAEHRAKPKPSRKWWKPTA